jgi:hypothetical protein
MAMLVDGLTMGGYGYSQPPPIAYWIARRNIRLPPALFDHEFCEGEFWLSKRLELTPGLVVWCHIILQRIDHIFFGLSNSCAPSPYSP